MVGLCVIYILTTQRMKTTFYLLRLNRFFYLICKIWNIWIEIFKLICYKRYNTIKTIPKYNNRFWLLQYLGLGTIEIIPNSSVKWQALSEISLSDNFNQIPFTLWWCFVITTVLLPVTSSELIRQVTTCFCFYIFY
jgi:hypothetical protein